MARPLVCSLRREWRLGAADPSYVFSEPIWAVALKKMTARVLLGGSTVVFGAITLGTAFATEWSHVMACRVLLGWFEGGMVSKLSCKR
jgi:predicted MFS family arabinose efflux permease